MEAENNSRNKYSDARDAEDKFSGWTADEQVECLLGPISESGSVSDFKALVKVNPFLFEDMAVRGVNTPLHVAARRGHVGLVREILNLRPALAERVNLDGLTPLHLAVESGHVDVVKELLSRNPGLHRARDCHGRTPLHYGAALGKDVVVQALMSLNSEDDVMEEVTHRGETPLHLAAKNKHKGAFQILMGAVGGELREKRIMSELTDKAGNTVVQLAHSNNMLTPTQSSQYGAVLTGSIGWNGRRFYKLLLLTSSLAAVSSMLANGPLYFLSLAAVSSMLAKGAAYFLSLCVVFYSSLVAARVTYFYAGQCQCDTTPRDWDTTGCMQHMGTLSLVTALLKQLLT